MGNLAALDEAFSKHGNDLAAVILEPLPANNGLLEQSHDFLKAVRERCTAAGTMLIFDEVITGFRFGFPRLASAKICNVEPDLTTLGKVVGGGLPVGAVLGKAAVMEAAGAAGARVSGGHRWQGTRSPWLRASRHLLDELKTGAPYAKLESLGKALDAKLGKHALKGNGAAAAGGKCRVAVLRLEGEASTRGR